MKIKNEELKSLSLSVLSKHGYTELESQQIFDSLLWSERRGSSQGISKLFGWRIEKLPEATSPLIEKRESSMVQINANRNNHILACNLAVSEILSSIGERPIFISGIKNAVNSSGSLGYFTEKFAKSGFVAIMLSAADPGVAPFGGSEPVFGTNPISISIPTDGDPILFDMSVASLTWGDLITHQHLHKPLPEGYAFDEKGEPTTDPTKAMDGCVTSFDQSPKGSGLAMMIQILAGPLVGSIYSKDHSGCQYGSLIIVINPSSFGDKTTFIKSVLDMITQVKSSRRVPEFSEILIPGESGYRASRNNSKKDGIEIPVELFSKINKFISK